MVTNIVIGLLVLVIILRRQLRARPVNADRPATIFFILGIVGIAQIVDAWRDHAPVSGGITLLALSLVVAAGFGVWRATSVRLWRDGGQLWQQGTPLTITLWVLAIGVHLGVDVLGHVIEPAHSAAATSVTDTLSASILAYIAVSFGVQRVVVGRRARAMTMA
jgi:hypothetical protein